MHNIFSYQYDFIILIQGTQKYKLGKKLSIFHRFEN